LPSFVKIYPEFSCGIFTHAHTAVVSIALLVARWTDNRKVVG